MKKVVLIVLGLSIIIACKQKQQPAEQKQEKKGNEITVVDKGDVKYDDYFKDKTMRLDYYHSRNNKEEHFAIDRIVSDGNWSGSKTVLQDKLDLGLYFFA